MLGVPEPAGEWTCRVCSHENVVSAEADGDRCALCAEPRPHAPPTEVMATLPLAGVLLMIGVCLPLVGNEGDARTLPPLAGRSSPLAGFIGTDIASFITFSHTMLLGAFGTVAYLSGNPLFGASVQLALTLATIVGACGTLFMHTWLSSCRIQNADRPLPLVIAVLFLMSAFGGAVAVLRSRRYPTFECCGSKRPSSSRCFSSLRVWLLLEFAVICLSMVARTLPTMLVQSSTTIALACDAMAAGHHRGWIVKTLLTGFVESFHVAFHESFLLGCGFAALWSRGFYVDLLALSSTVFGAFYLVHAIAACTRATSDSVSVAEAFSRSEQMVTPILRAIVKLRILCIAMRMRRERGTRASSSSFGDETWVRPF